MKKWCIIKRTSTQKFSLVYGYGKTYKDYGLDFYCIDDLNMAKEWSVERNRDGYANCYELETDNLQILDLNSEYYCILH